MITILHCPTSVSIILLIGIAFNLTCANKVMKLSFNSTQNNIKRSTHSVAEDKNVGMQAGTYETKHVEYKEVITNNITYEYDYLLKEYYDDIDIASNTNTTCTDDVRVIIVTNSSFKELKNLSLKKINCLLPGIRTQTRIITQPKRLCNIIKVWFLVYLIVAVPLWCTRGWCCCCLFCKFFKPIQSIEEAKKFLEANPPGVLQDKKGRVALYEPCNKEKYCHDKLSHLIRTI